MTGSPGNVYSSGPGNNFLDMLSLSDAKSCAGGMSSSGLTEHNFGQGGEGLRSRLDQIRDITEVKVMKLSAQLSKARPKGLNFLADSESEMSMPQVGADKSRAKNLKRQNLAAERRKILNQLLLPENESDNQKPQTKLYKDLKAK